MMAPWIIFTLVIVCAIVGGVIGVAWVVDNDSIALDITMGIVGAIVGGVIGFFWIVAIILLALAFVFLVWALIDN